MTFPVHVFASPEADTQVLPRERICHEDAPWPCCDAGPHWPPWWITEHEYDAVMVYHPDSVVIDGEWVCVWCGQDSNTGYTVSPAIEEVDA